MSTEFVLPAALFSDEPVEREVVMNRAEIDAAEAERDALAAEGKTSAASEVEIPEPKPIWFLLLPVTATIDAEYTKNRGHNESKLSFRPNQGQKHGKAEVEFEPIDRVFSNDKELSATKKLAKKVIKGWRRFRNTNGEWVEFSEHNLERLSEYPQYIRPALDEAYKIADLKSEVESGNSETSSGGNANPDEDHDGPHIGAIAD
ncbi:MAG: hypothetical protein DRJ50_02580 [Actinobacteria bacterium]|nr:MAG: hypothetical protein DRJ50_02580 [Actinomycetota bacterium]